MRRADESPALGSGRYFSDVTEELGIEHAFPRLVDADDYFMPDSMGPGCALLDYDDDGLLDIYLVNGVRGRSGGWTSPQGANRLLRQSSDGSFEDVTLASGTGHEGYGMGAAVGDVDNDGDLDIYVTNLGPNCLLVNQGDGTFMDGTADGGVEGVGWGASAAFFDADGDGWLDLFVTNYVAFDPDVEGRDAAGRPEYPSPSQFRSTADFFFRNLGRGKFVDESEASGIAGQPGKGLGVVCTDLDGDGLVDVYVANDGEANFAWINDGHGRFVDEAWVLGLAVNEQASPEASMGIAAGDPDRDGDMDLFLTHLVQETNTFYRQLSAGAFVDDSHRLDLGAPSIDVTGFGTSFVDVDLDGDLDLLAANGRVLRGPVDPRAELEPHWLPYAEANQLFLNDGAGGFASAPELCGDFCDTVEVSRGLASGDIDRDGDLDLVVSNGNGTLRVYRNDAPRRGSWLTVRVLDAARQRDAIGAVSTVHTSGGSLRAWLVASGSYLSASELVAHFGLGAAAFVDSVDVRWPDGVLERFPGCPVDRRVTLAKGTGMEVRSGTQPFSKEADGE